jgi:predicted GNAT family acetyltransferase
VGKYVIRRGVHGVDVDVLQLACLPGDDPVPRDQGNLCWVAYDSTGPVAFVLYVPVDSTMAYLKRAGTLPRARGVGLYPRLNRAAFSYLRRQGVKTVVTDCTYWNVASANGLYKAGFTLYTPQHKWAFEDGLYWWKDL